MRRVRGEYEDFKGRLTQLRSQVEGLAAALDKQGLSSPADRVRLVGTRLGNIHTLSKSLGNTAPGLDESTLSKIDAEWKICQRLAGNVTGMRGMGTQLKELVGSMNACDAFLRGLMKG